MSFITLECPRCGSIQEGAHFNRRVCCSCRIKEERENARGPKGRAWAAATRAIRVGAIVRAPCEVCGDEKSEAHHDDYAKPLEIRWLCRTHHKRHHYKFGPGKNAYKETRP